VSLFAVAYEIGYILFRLGSMIIQPMLEIMFGQTEYTDFIAAENTSEKAHTKLETLSREYVYARTQITLFIALVALTAIQSQWWIMCVCIMCVSLFIMSARGYMKRIKKAVTQYLATINSYSEAASNGE
jgi:hypothetical protein